MSKVWNEYKATRGKREERERKKTRKLKPETERKTDIVDLLQLLYLKLYWFALVLYTLVVGIIGVLYRKQDGCCSL